MNMPALAAQVAWFTALATFIWLLARAFHWHTGWGIAVLLFSPVSAIVFGIRNWRDVKVPFLAYLVTTFIAVTLSLYLFTNWGGWDLLQASQRVQRGIAGHTLNERDYRALHELSQEFDEQSGFDMQSSSLLSRAQNELVWQAEQQAAEESARIAAKNRKYLNSDRIDKKVKPAEKRYRLAYITIKPADASKYIGATVKVTRKNVVEKEYRLIGASGNRLEFMQRAGSGSYSFRYKSSDIEKIRVLTKQPY